MNQGSSKQPSEPLLKLFQEAWNELCTEKGEGDPITTIQIETRDGEKKNVNGFEFWQQMIEEVEKQKDDPDYLYYSPIDEENIEDLFTATDEPQPEEKPTFYMKGKYYIPRISNLYLQNLNLGFDQWYIVQDIPPSPKVIKILRRKRYVSPSSTDDEVMLELIYAMEISEKNEKERLANKKKEFEEKKEIIKDSENIKVNIELEKLVMQELEKPETSKYKEIDESDIIELNAFLEPDKQLNFADMENVQKIMLAQIKMIQKIERDRERANTLETQIQVLEAGKTEDVMEAENTKETEQMSQKGRFEARCTIDLCSYVETEDEVSQQREFGTSSFLDLASCLDDVGEIPKQTEQLSQDLASSKKEKDKVPKKMEKVSQKRKFEACYSKNLASFSGEEREVSPKNTTQIQVAPNPYQDTVLRDLRPNVATQNVNPQNLGININDPNVVTSPQIPGMITPNYGQVPFFNEQDNLRPFSFRFSRPQFSQPPPAHSQPRLILQDPLTPNQPPPPAYLQLFPQHPFTPTETPPRALSSEALMQELWRAQRASLPRMSPLALLQELCRQTGALPTMSPRTPFPHLPLIPTPPLAHRQIYHRTSLNSGLPPPAHQTQKQSVERNQQSLPLLYPSIQPPSQWTPQSKPLVIHNPNTEPNHDPQNFQLAHEPPRTQIAPYIPSNADKLHFANYVPAHLSNVSTTRASRKRVLQDISNNNPWECIISIKKRSGQSQLIAQAPLSSIIPLPGDDIQDYNQDDNQSHKFVLPSLNAKPKKSALRRHDVKRNKRRRKVHFSQNVIERDEMKKRIARSTHHASNVKDTNNLMENDDVEDLQRQLLDEISKLHFIENDIEEESMIEFKLEYNEANSDN